MAAWCLLLITRIALDWCQVPPIGTQSRNRVVSWVHVNRIGDWLIDWLISNFRRVLSIVCNLLRISPASNYWMPTFRNTLSVPSSKAGYLHIQPLKLEQIKCSETSAFNNQTPEKYPKDYTQRSAMLVSNAAARSRNRWCNGQATMRSVCIVQLQVIFNITIMNAAQRFMANFRRR